MAGQEADASSYAAVYVPAPARRPGGGRAARGGGSRRSGGGGGQRAQRPDLKGKPSFSELVESGFMRPGAYTFTVGTQEVAAVIEDDGEPRLLWGEGARALAQSTLLIYKGPLYQRGMRCGVGSGCLALCGWGPRVSLQRPMGCMHGP